MKADPAQTPMTFTSLLPLLRLLQLASPLLPVGAYSYSQGLEAAVEQGAVRDAASAKRWIADALRFTVAAMEAPVFLRLYDAWREADSASVRKWNEYFIASRETAELRAETLQMGFSLAKLIGDTGLFAPEQAGTLGELDVLAFPAAFTFAAAAAGVPAQEAVAGYLWCWLENQVLAAIKCVPLGQTAGQKLLYELAGTIPELVADAARADDAALSNFAPGLAITSSRHETQYSRIFRS
jgi:urease accessory protein